MNLWQQKVIPVVAEHQPAVRRGKLNLLNVRTDFGQFFALTGSAAVARVRMLTNLRNWIDWQDVPMEPNNNTED